MTALHDVIRPLFVTGLQNIHAVEQQALALLSRQVERLEHYPDLEARLRSHIEETHQQVARIDAVLGSLGEHASTLKDAGLTLSGEFAVLSHQLADDEILKNSFADYMFENFEVASYTGLIVMAEEGGFDAALEPLRQSLAEEQAMAVFMLDAIPGITRTFIQRSTIGVTASH